MSEYRQPPHDLASEEAVLGAILMSPVVLPVVSLDDGLKPGHFYRDKNGDVYAAMLALSDRDEPIDTITLAGELERKGIDLPTERVEALAVATPEAGNVRAYARRIIELAELRQLRRGAQTIIEGVDAFDPDAIREGERLLRRDDAGDRRTSPPDALAEEFWRHLNSGPPETFRWPFPRLDKLMTGGMRRGQVTLIGGWSSHGKSVFLDQSLESAARAGLRVHLFINEMTKIERTMRMVARVARVPFDRVAENRADPEQTKKILDACEDLPFGITDCTDWTVEDVCREIRRCHYDIVGVDMFNRFPFRGRDRRVEMEEASRQLNVLSITANCHILLAVHLNRARATGSQVLPFPTPGDIRETGNLYNDAPNCLFVWREQDEDTGEPLPGGVVRFAKIRNGRPGGIPVIFEGDFMTFKAAIQAAPPVAEQPQEAAF